MEQNPRMYKFLVNLPFWWILLTTIYVSLTFLGGGVSRLLGLLGLFVPIGVCNLSYSLFYPPVYPFERVGENNPGVITFPLVLLTIFGGEWFIHKLNLSPTLKIFVILGILFALTIAVDFVIWRNWQSLELIMAGGKLRCDF